MSAGFVRYRVRVTQYTRRGGRTAGTSPMFGVRSPLRPAHPDGRHGLVEDRNMGRIFSDWNYFRWVTSSFTILRTWTFHWSARI